MAFLSGGEPSVLSLRYSSWILDTWNRVFQTAKNNTNFEEVLGVAPHDGPSDFSISSEIRIRRLDHFGCQDRAEALWRTHGVCLYLPCLRREISPPSACGSWSCRFGEATRNQCHLWKCPVGPARYDNDRNTYPCESRGPDFWRLADEGAYPGTEQTSKGILSRR